MKLYSTDYIGSTYSIHKIYKPKINKNNFAITNELGLSTLKEISQLLVSHLKAHLSKQELLFNQNLNKFNIFNKLTLDNNISNYYYEHNNNLDDEIFDSNNFII